MRDNKFLRSVRAIAFDFDGVFTDNRVFVNEQGQESVACNRSDGFGVGLLRKAGIHMTIISMEQNPVVIARAKKLGLDVVHGCDDKLPVFRQWMQSIGTTVEDTLFMGNDINDLECMEYVRTSVAPSDALPLVLRRASIVTERPGGHGAVRELVDAILSAQDHDRLR